MGNGLFHAVHSLDRQNIIQILRTVIFFCSGNAVRQDLPGAFVSPQFYVLRLQGFRHLRKELIPDGTMHHQRLTGIADTDPLGLGIHQYFYRHIHIRILVHIDVAVAGSGLYDGDRAVLHHAADQSRTASWDQHIHIFLHLHKLRSDRTIRIFDQLYGSPGHTAGFQCIL